MIIQAFHTGDEVPTDATYLTTRDEKVMRQRKVKKGKGASLRDHMEYVEVKEPIHYFLVSKKVERAKEAGKL